MLHYRATYDERLRNHLETSAAFLGTSHDIQNDLIDSVSAVLLNKIKEEIKEATFVAVIEEEVTDLTQTSQLSSVIRYVTHEDIQERFIWFIDVSTDRSAVSLAGHVFSLINEFQFGDKLVAQTYDGCSVMAGVHNGLQQIIRAKYQSALFVHCYAHKLNLVLKQSVTGIKECKYSIWVRKFFLEIFKEKSCR